MGQQSVDILEEIFYNPKYGFTGYNAFLQRVKSQHPEIRPSEIKKFYDSQEINQVYKRVQKPRHFKTIIAPPGVYQIDITHFEPVFTPNKWLSLIEIDSRKAFMFPMSNKSNKIILELLSDFPEKIKILESDDEFDTKAINEYCEKHNINLYSVVAKDEHLTKHSGNSLGIIDRFTRTIKNMLNRYYLSTGNRQINLVIPDLVNNYNETIHSTTHMTPNEAIKHPEKIVHSVSKFIRPTFQVGDRVRVAIMKNIFHKEQPAFSKAIYQIQDTLGAKYLVNNKYYKPNELQKITDVQQIPDEIKTSVHQARTEVVQKRKIRQEGITDDNILTNKRVPQFNLEAYRGSLVH